jgi:Predicted ATPase (AAA+ superfamily)
MIQEQILRQVIEIQQNYNSSKQSLFAREYFVDYKTIPHFALIIAGVRRCGKSSVLIYWQQISNASDVLYLNFDNSKLFEFEMVDFGLLDKIIAESGKKRLFFDEIQVVNGWEVYVREKLDEGFDVIITGSNASLLSKELGTKLTGRHITKELFPFSYPEFLKFLHLENETLNVDKYLKMGGFPEYLSTGDTLVLESLFDDILYRDIAVRYGIRDVHSFRKLAVYLLTNIGTPVSANRLKQVLTVKSTATILEYFSYLENSYLVFFVPVFSYSQKKQLIIPRKVYAIDTGLADIVGSSFTENKGRKLENVIFLFLRRKYKEIYYFNNKKSECDFVIVENGQVTEVVQVCYELTHDNQEREFNGLNTAIDELYPRKATIITYSQTDSYIYNKQIVNIVPFHTLF